MSNSSEGDPREAPRRRLPVLDLTDFLSGDAAAIDTAAAQLQTICQDVGFGSVIGHGISPDVFRAVEAATRRFHDLPIDDKLAIEIDQHQRGYVRPKGTLLKHSTYAENTTPDLNGTLVLATEHADDDPGVLAGRQFFSRNQWPEGLDGFREATLGYMDTINDLGVSILPLFARALELDDNFFEPWFEGNYNYLRMAHYPPKPEIAADEFGLGAHADTGFMTFLIPAEEEGLQLLDRDGTWFWPELDDGALILNLGHFLERWSNDRFRATPHRVIPPRHNDRYSVACFINTNFDVIAECLPTCQSADNPPRYPAQSYHEFYTWYMHQSYRHYSEFAEDDDSGNVRLR